MSQLMKYAGIFQAKLAPSEETTQLLKYVKNCGHFTYSNYKICGIWIKSSEMFIWSWYQQLVC